MRDSIYKIALDMHNTASQVQISAKLYDTARRIHISLVEDGKPYAIESGSRAVITIQREGSTVVNADCDIDLTSNIIIYTFSDVTTDIEGIDECEIKVYAADGTIVTSPRFTILVDASVYNDGESHGIDHAKIINRDLPKQHAISAITGLTEALAAKAEQTSLDEINANKVDSDTFKSLSENLMSFILERPTADSVYTKTDADDLLAGKVDASQYSADMVSITKTYYTRGTMDDLLADKADKATVYTKTDADDLLAGKVDASQYSADMVSIIKTYYTRGTMDDLLADKADKDSVYTKTDADDLLADKADKATVYTKTDADDLLADKIGSDAFKRQVGNLESMILLKADKADITTPFVYKGSCAYTDLPTTGNTQNDTYYVTDKGCNYSWNGTGWSQSGLDENQYETQLSTVKRDIEEADTRARLAENELSNRCDTLDTTCTDLSAKCDTTLPQLVSAETTRAKDAEDGIIEQLSYKAGIATVYTKTETDNLLDDKADTTDIPTKLSQLISDMWNRTVTDAQIKLWTGINNRLANVSICSFLLAEYSGTTPVLFADDTGAAILADFMI